MKRLVLLLCLLTSICSAQVEHSGLTIPGDGAVQVALKSGDAIDALRSELDVLFVPTYGVSNTSGGAFRWESVIGNEVASISVETAKPSVVGNEIVFAGSPQHIDVWLPNTLGISTDFTICVGTNEWTSGTYIYDGFPSTGGSANDRSLLFEDAGTTYHRAFGGASNPGTATIALKASKAHWFNSYRTSDGTNYLYESGKYFAKIGSGLSAGKTANNKIILAAGTLTTGWPSVSHTGFAVTKIRYFGVAKRDLSQAQMIALAKKLEALMK